MQVSKKQLNEIGAGFRYNNKESERIKNIVNTDDGGKIVERTDIDIPLLRSVTADYRM